MCKGEGPLWRIDGGQEWQQGGGDVAQWPGERGQGSGDGEQGAR